MLYIYILNRYFVPRSLLILQERSQVFRRVFSCKQKIGGMVNRDCSFLSSITFLCPTKIYLSVEP